MVEREFMTLIASVDQAHRGRLWTQHESNWFWASDWQHLEGRRLRSNEEVEMAIRKWLWILKLDFCGDGIFNLSFKNNDT
jgi:hypothetical protein